MYSIPYVQLAKTKKKNMLRNALWWIPRMTRSVNISRDSPKQKVIIECVWDQGWGTAWLQKLIILLCCVLKEGSGPME
jgi:hypothetical protein